MQDLERVFRELKLEFSRIIRRIEKLETHEGTGSTGLDAETLGGHGVSYFATASHVHDASEITYTPTTLSDWTGSADPGNQDDVNDQLASRVTTIESGGSTDNNAIHDNVAGEISALTEKAVPDSDDVLIMEDSAATYAKKKVRVGSLGVGSGGHEVRFEGTPYTQRTGLNYVNGVGTAVSITDDSINDQTTVEVDFAPGGLSVKASPTDADTVIIQDNADGGDPKVSLIGNLPFTDLTVRETDSSPSVAHVQEIVVPNGSLTDNGSGSVSLDLSGSTGGSFYPSFVTPVDGDFSWINQGGASVDASSGMIHLSVPAASGTNYRVRAKTAPSTPYTLTTALVPLALNYNYHMFGIGFRDSSDGKMHLLRVFWADAWLMSSQWVVDATTEGGDYVTLGAGPYAVIWLRLSYDGTNRVFSFSLDGTHFLQIDSQSDAYLSPDQILFFGYSGNASYPCGVTLYSWEET